MCAADFTQTDPRQRKLLRVCRIGRAQGLKGEVNVRSFTDDPVHRFAPGSVLLTAEGTEFTVLKSRNFKSRWILLFDGVTDRNASEALNGIDLFIDKNASPAGSSEGTEDADDEEEGWYLDDLVGLEVLTVDDPEAARAADYDGVEAHRIGTISAVINNTAQDVLEVALDGDESTDGRSEGVTALIPFVEQIVPIIDVEEGYILIDPPAGLLNL
ncbi:ribosome maturation factor RimM [Alloscardovia criceti]|uniref:ribosome maturation factor RimM n=1 Tax=Alloscardovia criceti TaxID=356828 RepID=UPI00037A068C|nr:ribosome maturation factor RimM [Alloscardovia criceti]